MKEFLTAEMVRGRLANLGKLTFEVTDASKEFGNVIIEPNAKVKVFKQNNEVIIKNGFECKQGAEFVVE